MGFFLIRFLCILSIPLAVVAADHAVSEEKDGVRRVRREGLPVNYAVQDISAMMLSGVVSQYSLDPRDHAREPDQAIDLAISDEFNQALKSIEEKVRTKLQREAQDLLQKDTWSLSDRLDWESRLAQAVSEERHRQPGLNSYRSVDDRKHRAQRRAVTLNELSIDIKNKSEMLEFDCEQMTAVDGVLLQRLEDSMLSGSGLKAPQPYVRATGFVYMEYDFYNGVKDATDSGHHVFLISSATGSIYEATTSALDKGVVYRKSITNWSGVDGYLKGDFALVHAEGKIIVYTSLPDATVAQSLVEPFKLASYLKAVPELIQTAEADAEEFDAHLSRYQAHDHYQKMLATLGEGGPLTEAQRESLKTLLKSSDIRNLRGQVSEWFPKLRFRLDNLRYLDSRLPEGEDGKTKVQQALMKLQSSAEARMRELIFDVEVADLDPGNSELVLKRRLSGRYEGRILRGDFKGSLPSHRLLFVEEDLNRRLEDTALLN